jgi:hypothetical protein
MPIARSRRMNASASVLRAMPHIAMRRLDAQRRLSSHKRSWDFARLAACYAQLRQLEEAGAQAAEALRLKPDFRLSPVRLYYKNSADALHVLEGMRKAGLPE